MLALKSEVLHTKCQQVTLAYAQNKNNKGAKMSIERMLEQTDERSDIKDVHNQLVAAYQASFPRLVHWPEFNGMRLLRSRDQEAGVYFVADITLPSNPLRRAAEGIIAKMIGMRLLDCTSYFLAQNIPVDAVPDTLKICLTVCHDNVHWTGVEITLPLFKTLYAGFLECQREPYMGSEISIHNQARNLVYAKLGIRLEKSNPDDIILPELDKMMQVVEYFSGGNLIMVKHFDSINADSNHAAIQESLMLVDRFVMFEAVPSAQQMGMTCGDHTVFNLFMSAHMNIIPAINSPGTMTSVDLRKLANASLNGGSDVPHAVTLLQSATPLNFNDDNEKQRIQCANAVLNSINALVKTIIQHLQKLDASQAAAIVQYAAAMSTKSPSKAVSMTKQQNKLYAELLSVFQGLHPIFAAHKVDADLRLSYGFHAEGVALDQCPVLAREKKAATKVSESQRAQAVRTQDEQFINAAIARVVENASKTLIDTVKRIVKEKVLIPTDDADAKKIEKLALLCQYKLRKQKEIGGLTFTNDYQQRLNAFYESSVAIIVGNDSEQTKADRVMSVAAQQFHHDHATKRFFADVLLFLSCLIGVGIYIGCKRLAEGKTFFKTSNTSLKQLQQDLVNPVLFSSSLRA